METSITFRHTEISTIIYGNKNHLDQEVPIRALPTLVYSSFSILENLTHQVLILNHSSDLNSHSSALLKLYALLCARPLFSRTDCAMKIQILSLASAKSSELFSIPIFRPNGQGSKYLPPASSRSNENIRSSKTWRSLQRVSGCSVFIFKKII